MKDTFTCRSTSSAFWGLFFPVVDRVIGLLLLVPFAVGCKGPLSGVKRILGRQIFLSLAKLSFKVFTGLLSSVLRSYSRVNRFSFLP